MRKYWNTPSTHAVANPSADELCFWEGPSSDLGLDTGRTPEPEPAAAAADEKSADAADDESSDDDATARASADADADADDVDEDVDPLDLLTTRDEPDEQTPQRTIEDRYKALSKRSRKLEKSLKKSLPIQQALREAGVDLRTLMASHARLTAYEASLQNNPRLRALLEGNADDAGTDDRRPAAREEAVEYPFDVNDPVGRFMQDFHQGTTKTNREILERLERMERTANDRLGRIENTTVAQQRSSTMQSWKTAADAAAGKLDKPVQKLFRDAVLAAAHGYLNGQHKLSPQQVIDHYLADFKVSDKQKRRASDAAAQKTAERNQTLPRRPAQGSGSPASPAARKVPRLEDFNRNLQRTMAR